ncbi:MAG: hypothetical protein HOZ81_53075 [Streptomyces sp.]|nr:hypothetical protein [Streptomyces sp.]NUP62303.1 hypothetical protein [Nonomuraea sp.]NUS05961.1 hypothetical protein [Nonomuraea sp.]
MSSSSSEDELKVPSQRSDEARRAEEDRDRANDAYAADQADDDGFGGRGVREDDGSALVRDEDDRLVAGGDRTASADHTNDDEPARDGTVYDEHARDRTDDELVRDRTGDELVSDRTDDELVRDRADDEPVRHDPAAYTPATHGYTPTIPTDDDESPYKDPYAAGDTAADPDPAHADVHSDEMPSHAAPQEVALFDQDPAQVQARWRDLQASFVDDPGEAVQRADGLVGEVVESLTSSITNRTHALRERWKDVDSPDTEDLRQAFRDYRNVLERLLALSTQSQGTQETRR